SLALFLRTQKLHSRLSETEAQLETVKKEKEAVEQELSHARSQGETSERELEVERTKRLDAEALLPPQARQASAKLSDSVTILLGAALGPRGASGRTIETHISDNVLWLRFVVPVKDHGGFDSFSLALKLAGES